MNSELKHGLDNEKDDVLIGKVTQFLTDFENCCLFSVRKAKDFGLNPILEVHDPEYVQYMRHLLVHHPDPGSIRPVYAHTQLCRHSPMKHSGSHDIFFDPKNVDPTMDRALMGMYFFDHGMSLTPSTWVKAYRSVQTVLTATEYFAALNSEKSKVVVAIVESAGHHAAKKITGGSSLFNHTIVAATKLLKDPWLTRTAVLDLSGTHGSGSQSLTYGQHSPVFVSVHAERAYPYHTGHASEKGLSFGAVSNFNVTLLPTANMDEYMIALDTALDHISSRTVSDLIVQWSPDVLAQDFCMQPEDMLRISSRLIEFVRNADMGGNTVHLLIIIDHMDCDLSEETVTAAVQQFLEGLTEWHFT